MTGQDIIERCERAWEEGRAVRLDFPDELRMRQQVDVVALQLAEVDEGEVLQVWVALPVEVDLSGEEFDDEDDEFFDDEDDDMDDDWRLLG